jgi:hypothetical protein
MNIPKWIRRGLMPCPSSGMTESCSNGFARKRITPRKKSSTIDITPTAYGDVYGNLVLSTLVLIAPIIEKASAIYNSDPAFPE